MPNHASKVRGEASLMHDLSEAKPVSRKTRLIYEDEWGIHKLLCRL